MITRGSGHEWQPSGLVTVIKKILLNSEKLLCEFFPNNLISSTKSLENEPLQFEKKKSI